jgi:thiol-disulfide isomerase/thioredoxin
MAPLSPGTAAPSTPGPEPGDGERAVVFYKVTCPTCQTAAPAIDRLHRAAPDRVTVIGQDPPEELEGFSRRFNTGFSSTSDTPPYPLSEAYQVRVVPTLFVMRDGRIAEVVESWDREGWNRASAGLAGGPLSQEGDGLPPFRPG